MMKHLENNFRLDENPWCLDFPPMRKLILKKKPASWNVVARKHYWTVKKEFESWQEATLEAVAGTRPRALPIPASWYPVQITFVARWKVNRRHDIDSLLVKPVVDAIVSLGLLPDDDLSHVGRVCFEGVIGATDGADTLEIRIEPMRTPKA